MAARKKSVVQEFVENDEEQLFVSEIPEAEVLDTTTKSGDISARVKGSWTMFWGQDTWIFNDGHRYKLPRGLFEYLKKNGNIYDTL
jgi:hypothetical protein